MSSCPQHRDEDLGGLLPEFPDRLGDGGGGGASGPRDGQGIRLSRLAGSSIWGRDAAPWVTDFLNAAYYRRPPDDRDIDDLRLAFCILTTYWHAKPNHRRLHASDLLAFHRAFGAHRFDRGESTRGTLSRGQLEAGGRSLLGDWFSDACADRSRRGWGIAFATAEERAAYDPEIRLGLARLGELTPETAPPGKQVWHTFPAVQMPSVERVLSALEAPDTWPDYASEIGRFTPLRRGGLDGQTFEVEMAVSTRSGWPLFTRGYLTVGSVVSPTDRRALRAYFDDVEEGMRRYGHGEPWVLPYAAQPILGFDLTAHAGHLMGAGHNRLLVYLHDARVWARAAGTWDPMPRQLDPASRSAAREALRAFWGEGNLTPLSMLHQLALQVA